MTIEEIIDYLEEQIESNKEEWLEAQKIAGVNSPGANQPLGAMDALQGLKDFIEGK